MKKACRLLSEFPGYRRGRKALPWTGSAEAYLQAYLAGKCLAPCQFVIGKTVVVA